MLFTSKKRRAGAFTALAVCAMILIPAGAANASRGITTSGVGVASGGAAGIAGAPLIWAGRLASGCTGLIAGTPANSGAIDCGSGAEVAGVGRV